MIKYRRKCTECRVQFETTRKPVVKPFVGIAVCKKVTCHWFAPDTIKKTKENVYMRGWVCPICNTLNELTNSKCKDKNSKMFYYEVLKRSLEWDGTVTDIKEVKK